uniref:Small ubiquitinlike modifier (SUMO) putative n=1 Tax=Albugo laibachii Nc14 TaxID=890382 RepID=F0WT23_9STRA|nr:small ubiquitinlike modifier (SUMO) putative [Albugo laibachii Nc14]|eukprot:CCA24509.1 small ubiquitinlike modifier (SUMO) putative [Albugo laibachii Nc14]
MAVEVTKNDTSDAKPDDKKKSEAITIRVKDQSGEEMFFRVKLVTKMEKVFEAYAERKNIDVTALRFLLDGTRISGDQTPKMLELEDQDQIDCALEQVGGLK